MTPPFLDTRILDPIALDAIEPLLDREALFAGRWQLRQGASAEAWEQIVRDKAEPTLARILVQAHTQGIFTPRIVYGYFACRQQGNGLIVEGTGRSYRFDFPRERVEPHRCLVDYFSDGMIAMQVATAGDGAARAAAAHFAKGGYSEVFYLKGLAAQLAEATAVYGHQHIRSELGASADQGCRFSPGYPAFPDILDQRKIFALLTPGRIGVVLTETGQMVPEYSTSAIISIDPRAAYFRP